jgi:GntR family transcriptional regulator/MocR family aminotransferase
MTAPQRPTIPAPDPQAAEPLYRQVYQRLRDAIAKGVLKPGDRIPSARALMAELGVARGTIESAYSLLAAEGFIQARGQAGTIVAPDLPSQHMPAVLVPPTKAVTAAPSFRPETTLPFQMGLPALDAFPRKIWARLGARCVRACRARCALRAVPDLRDLGISPQPRVDCPVAAAARRPRVDGEPRLPAHP